jgi:hypothetical protein
MPATMTRPADRTEMMPKTARSACLTLLLAIGLAGPARAQPTETPLPAPGTSAHRWGAEVCVIRVPVADCMAAGGIQLDRPLVEGRDIARLRWTIDTPSFTFANVCAVHRRTGRRIRGPTGGSTERVAGAQPQRDHGRVPVRPHAHGPGLPAGAGLGAQGGIVGAAAAPAVHSIADVPEGEGQGALAALSVCIDTATKSPVPDRWPCGLVRQRDRATTSDSEEASLDKFIAWAAPGLLLSAALASCAQPRRPDAPPPGLAAERCTPGICELKVTVTNCHSATGITVDKPLVEATSAVNMRWTIVTPGFEFDTDGIRFDPANPQFERQPSPRRNEFRIQNKKSRDGDFYYFIHVKGCEVADPWVRNTR